MNMVRIRHIMEMRRACKAPPLLPPKLRKEASESSDRRYPKDILDVNCRIQILNPERIPSGFYNLQLYESQDSADGPWKLITETDKLDVAECYDLEDIFAIEFCFERPQFIRIELCEDNIFKAADVFSIAQVTLNPANIQLSDQSKYLIGEIEIWTQIREKPQPVVMQIEARNINNKFASSNSNLYLEVYRLDEMLQKRVIHKSESVKQSRLIWKSFTIQGEDSPDSGQLEICCFSEDEREGCIGQAIITSDAIKTGEPIPMFHESYRMGRKPCGEFRVVKNQQLKIFSFLDYLRCGTSLRFAFAIDFSVREQLSREEQIQFANDVDFAVRCVGDAVEPFNSANAFLSYGFGAKIPPQYRESNNFCLSLDVEASCQGVGGVIGSFMQCYQRVQPSQSAKFSQIIYHLARNAQTSFNRVASYGSYFVLFVITRGSVEDLKETVQAAIFSSKSPISIVFIGVGCDGLDEIERIGNAGKRLEYQGRKSERDNLQFVNATKTRLESDNYNEMSTNFIEKALGQITWQMSTFFMQNHVTPGGGSEDNGSTGSRRMSSMSRESSSVEQLNLGSSYDDIRLNSRLAQRSSETEQKNRRRHLTSEMRAMTIDDSRHF